MAQGAKAAALPGVQGAGLPPQDPGAGGQTPSALRTPGKTIARRSIPDSYARKRFD